jgi:hypothetical protein
MPDINNASDGQRTRIDRVLAFNTKMRALNDRINSRLSSNAGILLSQANLATSRLQDAFKSGSSTLSGLSRAEIEALLLPAEKSMEVVAYVLNTEAIAGRLDSDIISQLGFSTTVKPESWSLKSLVRPIIFWGGSYLAYKFYRKRTKGAGVALIATAATVVPILVGTSIYSAYKQVTK